MSKAQLRRTYTTARKNNDDSQSFDDSVMISSTSSSTGHSSEGENSTNGSKKNATQDIGKNTSKAEVGKPKKNMNQKNQLKMGPDRILVHQVKLIKKLSNLLKN